MKPLSVCLLLAGMAALAAAEPAPGFTDADYANAVAQARALVPAGESFTIIVQRPFVVVGDGDADMVQAHAAGTVKRAVDGLRRDYFTRDPAAIFTIWLFKDADSYQTHSLTLFQEKSDSPYGYCLSSRHALVMNIATGGGTLVHEIVHAYIDANFPGCPTWFNEGLASLYERCGEQDGHIHGYCNWRLPILQEAIRDGTVPGFAALTSLSSNDFYEGNRGANYAAARYLCYYLQERDLLHRFYREFLANHRDDPTGIATLKAVLGEEDLDAVAKRWRDFVLTLEEPR
jgi:hypothetical protein